MTASHTPTPEPRPRNDDPAGPPDHTVEFSPEARVRVGIKEMSGTRVLNDEVEIR